MVEYKIILGIASECQKKLNQWKHEFDLKILAMCTCDENIIVILLTRKRKETANKGERG